MATPFNQLLSNPVDQLGKPANDPFQIHKFTRTEIIFNIKMSKKTIKINELCRVVGA